MPCDESQLQKDQGQKVGRRREGERMRERERERERQQGQRQRWQEMCLEGSITSDESDVLEFIS